MKIVNYMSAGLIAMTLAGVMLPITSVFAADEPIKKTSVGEVRVGVDPDNPDPNNPDNPDGSKDILSLVKVPDLKFKSVSVEQLATGQQTLPLTSNTVTDKPVKNEPAGNASDGNNQGLLNITDYRGNGAGWKLEAQAGELKNAAGQKLAGSL
ncbi:Extracellular protein, partial [Lacticaseibacillus paracasei subsp. paracasei Lpp14]